MTLAEEDGPVTNTPFSFTQELTEESEAFTRVLGTGSDLSRRSLRPELYRHRSEFVWIAGEAAVSVVEMVGDDCYLMEFTGDLGITAMAGVLYARMLGEPSLIYLDETRPSAELFVGMEGRTLYVEWFTPELAEAGVPERRFTYLSEARAVRRLDTEALTQYAVNWRGE